MNVWSNCKICLQLMRLRFWQLPLVWLQDVARMNPGEAVKMDHEYKSFLAELGGAPPVEMGAAPRGGLASS